MAQRLIRILYVVPGTSDKSSTMIFAHNEITDLARAGVEARTFLFDAGVNPWRALRMVRAMWRLARDFRPDGLHAHFGSLTAFACALVSLVARTPLIVTYRGSDLNPSPSDGALRNVGQKLLSQIAALRASAIICVSEELKRRLWWRRAKAIVLSDGVDMQVFRPIPRAEARKQLGWGDDERVVLFNAGLTPAVKRLDLAEASVAEMRKVIEEARLVVLRGETPHIEIPLYLNAADCLLMTSDYEGSPVIIKEALACRLPIVSVEVGDVVQRLKGVRPSKIVRRDAAEIGAALAELVSSGERSNGRERISDVSSEVVRRRIVEIYTRTLCHPGNHSVPPKLTKHERLQWVRMTQRSVSTIIPCRNEAAFIGECLDSIVKNDYPKDRLEVLVVDAMSDDDTRSIVACYARRYPFIRLLDNLKKIPSAAFNMGIANSQGDLVMLLSAHSTYPTDYISTTVRFLEQYHADNAGGILNVVPRKRTAIANAIALAVAHPFGSGNARIKTGAKEPKWSDTTAFGCYRREVFQRVGLFNEELGGSSDLDFNVRLRASGGRILLVPQIVINYFADGDLRSFWRHNFSDGVWSTYVLKFRSKAWSWRHWVPLAFILSLMISGVLSVLVPDLRLVAAILGGAYILASLGASLQVALAQRSVAYFFLLPVAFASRHFAHGFGALWGLVLVMLPGARWQGRHGRHA